MITLLGTWLKPSVFITITGEQLDVYSYKKVIEKISFPIDCFIQLDGNIIKSFIEVV